MKKDQNGFYTIVGYVVLGVLILTDFKGIDVGKLREKAYLLELYNNGKQIIERESSKTMDKIKGTDLLRGK